MLAELQVYRLMPWAFANVVVSDHIVLDHTDHTSAMVDQEMDFCHSVEQVRVQVNVRLFDSDCLVLLSACQSGQLKPVKMSLPLLYAIFGDGIGL